MRHTNVVGKVSGSDFIVYFLTGFFLLCVAMPVLAAPRVTSGQQVLYTFEEGTGTTVTDVSGVGTPLDLTIETPAAASWVADGLSVSSNTIIASAGAASKVISAVKASNAVTIEAWVVPANTTQDGPARILSLSQDLYTRNFTLGQSQSDYSVRLRSSATSDNGTPSTDTASGLVTTALTHVVYTRDAAGVATIYIDGTAQANATVSGSFSGWDNAYRLSLANELTGDRPWLGELYLVAIFDRALNAAEVSQNYSAGSEGTGGGNLAPIADAGPDQFVAEGGTVSLNGTASNDTDGTITTYSWTQTAGPTVTLSDASTATPNFIAPSVSTDTVLGFQLTVTDNASATDTSAVNVTVQNVNQLPTANAGIAQTVTEGSTVSLDGTVSSDADGTITTYAWVQTAGPGVTLSGASTATPGFTAPAVSTDTTLTFQLTVTDNDGGTATAAAYVTVQNVNQPPTANAGIAQTVTEGSAVNLDGTASSDADGTITAYSWVQTAGPVVTLSGETTSTPNFTAPGVTTDTVLSFQLTVTDDAGAFTTDSVNVTVTPDIVTPPGIVTQPIDQTVMTGQAATFSIVASGSAPLSYQWRRDYVDIPGATGSSYTTPGTTLADSGITYDGVVSNAAGSVVSSGVTLTVLSSARITSGQQVLYTFEEGTGTTVTDVSGTGTPLNLTIETPAATTWVAGGLSVNSSALITSAGAASKVITAVKASNALTIEAWLTPANTTQSGPARVVSLSQDLYARNFTLGQSQSAYSVRLRSSATSNNGTPSTDTASGLVTTALSHVVYTRDAAGAATIYIDGVVQASATVSGSLSGWDNVYRLALANELAGDRPWLGELHLVAVFDRALSAAEISQNYNAGPEGTGGGGNLAPVADAGPDQSVTEGDSVNLDGTASSDVGGTITTYSWMQTAGPMVTLSGASTATPSFTAPNVATDTVLSFQLTVTDNEDGSSNATVSVTVAVQNANQLPTADAGLNQSVTEGDAVSLDGTASSDSDGIIAAYSWTQIAGPTITLGGVATATPGFTAPDVTADTVLSFQLTITDNDGGIDTAVVSITVQDGNQLPNQLPVANAGGLQIVSEGSLVNFDGTASSDFDGSITTYSWTQKVGPSVALNGATTATPNFTAPNVNADTVFNFLLTVTDNNGGTDSASVNIAVRLDFDGDGIPDATDLDDDNDDVPDNVDVFPLNPHDSVDTDSDGIGNNTDLDDDGDGYPDQMEISAGTDSLDATSMPVSQVFKGSQIPMTGDTTVFFQFDDASKAAGTNRSYTRDNIKDIVRDNSTGLIWQDNNDAKDLQLTQTYAKSHCLGLTLGGIDSWRLPSRLELLYLVDYSREGIVLGDTLIDPAFINGFNDKYWTEEVVANGSLVVGFRDGQLTVRDFNETLNVRCVTGTGAGLHWTQTAYSPYLISQDQHNVVLDTKNYIMWQDTVDVVTQKFTWENAINYCENLTIDGYADWRLPNVNESHSVLAELAESPQHTFSFMHEDVNGFGNPPRWWTSSTHPYDYRLDEAWDFYALPGRSQQRFKVKTVDNYVRCVHDFSPPIAKSGNDIITSEGASIIFDGSASYDPDGSIVSYAWFVRTKFQSQVISTAASFSKSDLTVGRHVIVLVVTDNLGLTSEDEIIVTVNGASNTPPIADSGVNQTVGKGHPVMLDGSDSSDPDGIITTYTWTQTAGPTVILSGTTTVTPTFIAPDVATETVFSFQLAVTDNSSSIDTAVVNITVQNASQLPKAYAAHNQSSVLEGGLASFTGASSYDVDGIISAYQWTQIQGPIATLNGVDTVTLGIIAPNVPSVPTTVLGFQLMVTDNEGGTDTDTVYITVQNVIQPPIANAGVDQAVIGSQDGYTYINLDGAASSDPDGIITTYSWTKTAGPFAVVENQTGSTINYIAENVTIDTVFSFQLTVVDNDGATDTATVNITAQSPGQSPPGQSPIANAGLDQTAIEARAVSLDGSASSDPDGTITTFSWAQSAGPVVTLNGANTIKPNFIAPRVEVNTLLNFQLTVTDNAGMTNSDVVVVTITPQPEYVMQACPVVNVLDDRDFVDSYPDENIDWTGNNFTDVQEIEKAFNHARLIDNSVFQYLKMPSQVEWNAMSAQEQGLYLINSERQARGIKPYEGINPNVVAVVQAYADYLRENNEVISHDRSSDGADPATRLYEDSLIRDNSAFHGESLFAQQFISTYIPSDTESVIRAVYTWIYFDKITLSGFSWGHRSHMLKTELDENSGENDKEGLIGFGISTGVYDPNQTPPVGTGAIVVFNTVDPIATWDHSSFTQTVDTDLAQQCNNDVIIDVDPSLVVVDQLKTLEITPSDILLTQDSSEQLQVIGTYQDGSQQDLTSAVSYIPDVRSVVSIDGGEITPIRKGSVSITARANGITSNRIFIWIGDAVDTSNLVGTYAEEYLNYIPANATISNYDPKAFSLFAGSVTDKLGMPLNDATISIHNRPEYGSVKTDVNGRFVIVAEAGTRSLVYNKNGYLTVHREVSADSNAWATADDVVMLEVDEKQTPISLNSAVPQIHTSTEVIDQFGSRSTTLVFNGITSAVVTSADGKQRSLENFSVRATEYELPESMPAELPVESAFTYCSELQIPGVRDDETVTFDKPVIMYVDNFLSFDVGEIVPIGYYDRKEGEWKASENGIVVKLLDANSDGLVDGVDYNGDDLADDVNNNGSTTDEIAGIENYPVGNTYWRGSFNHFTPWDFNWPYRPPADAVQPTNLNSDDSDETPLQCEAVATNSFVKPEPQAFHEDIPITGTDITLHYSSQRTEGYKHKLTVQVSGDTVAASMTEMLAKLEIGGKTFIQTFSPQTNVEAEFIWDGNDVSGKRINGVVRGRISIGYKYDAEYTSFGKVTTVGQLFNEFETAWAKLGANTTGVRGRNDFISWNSDAVSVQNTFESPIANGWSLSNHHVASSIGKVYMGDGDVIDGDKSSLILKTGIKTSEYVGDDGFYQKGGSDIDYTVNGKGVLKDIVTGLEWQYIDKPEKFRNKILASDYCSFSALPKDTGWRLPTAKEIVYTIDKASGQHDFPIYLFEALNYWKDTTSNNENSLIPVICVRGETINTKYIADLKRNDTAEVVVDGQNGLMWQDDASTTSIVLDWEDSIDYCENLEHAGHLNWRLPNINELTYALPNPTFVNQTTLPSEPWTSTVSFRNPYWSSTPNFSNPYQAWAMESVSFSDYDFSKTDLNYVRCVRDDLTSLQSPYRFDKDGKHLKTIDLDTGKTLLTFGYDGNGQLNSITDRFDNTVTINRDLTSGKALSIVSHDSYVTDLLVDNNNDLTQVDYNDGSSYQFSYTQSLMTSEIDPNSNEYLHQFDTEGRVIQTSDPEGGVWDFFANRAGNNSLLYGYTTAENNSYQTLRSILANGDTQKTTTFFDGTELTITRQADKLKEVRESCGETIITDNVLDSKTKQEIPNKITRTLPSGMTSVIELTKNYAENGADTSKQRDDIIINGVASSIDYDVTTGVKIITSAESRTTTLSYDPETLLLQSSQVPGLLDTSYDYDSRGRLTGLTTGVRNTVYTYDDALSQGNLTSITTPDNKTTSFDYDLLGRLEKVNYSDTFSTEYRYDSKGNLTSVIIPTLVSYDFGHNAVDNVSSETNPFVEVTQYNYDRDRNLTEILLPSGSNILNTYSNGLLSKSQTPEGDIDYAYTCGSKISNITEGAESLDYTYDGNLLTGLGYLGVLDQTISQNYNNNFEVITLTYAGQDTELTYDNDGLVTGANGFTIDRNVQNGLSEALSDGTLQQALIHNGYGEINSVSTRVNNQPGYDYVLSYNNLGEIIAKEETLDNGTVNDYVYGYDNKRRLTSVSKNGTEIERYDYDANGNRTLQSNSTRSITAQSATYNIGDQLKTNGSTSYAYDADGYLRQKTTTAGITTYQYSSQGRLLFVQTPDKTIEYLHNALGNRVAKKVDGLITEKYLWLNKTTLLATYDATDALLQRFEYTDSHTPASFEQGGQRYYIVTDHLGSPRAVTNSAGVIIKKLDYDSFGNVISDSNLGVNIPFGFAGGLYDTDTDLIRFGYRDYDPDTGRWTARDPIGFAGGDTNLYGYVFSDPINWTDPLGLAGGNRGGPGTIYGGVGNFGINGLIRQSQQRARERWNRREQRRQERENNSVPPPVPPSVRPRNKRLDDMLRELSDYRLEKSLDRLIDDLDRDQRIYLDDDGYACRV